jgi:hypothetical protein
MLLDQLPERAHDLLGLIDVVVGDRYEIRHSVSSCSWSLPASFRLPE